MPFEFWNENKITCSKQNRAKKKKLCPENIELPHPQNEANGKKLQSDNTNKKLDR